VLHDISVTDTFFDERIFDFRGGDGGVLGTVIVGWDWQLGPKTVFGIFADYDFFDFSTHHRAFDFFDHSIDHDNAWSAGARLGVLTSPSTLWYVAGGYTQLQLDHSVTFDGFTFSRDRTLDGFFVGGGVDTRLAASNWFLRLEYRFSQFDTGGLRDDDFGFNVDTDVETHTARLTLTYKVTPGLGWGPRY
jgi:outer membrane immunogenic protein